MTYHCHVLNYPIEADNPIDAANTMRELLQGGWPIITVTEEQIDEDNSGYRGWTDVDTEAYFHPYEGN